MDALPHYQDSDFDLDFNLILVQFIWKSLEFLSGEARTAHFLIPIRVALP
jgi:hypothetical protein